MARSAAKAPAYQWYPKDYEADEAVKLMSYEEEGIYRRLLDHQWCAGSVPADPALVVKLLPKIKNKKRFIAKLWPKLSTLFTINGSPDRLINRRLERQRKAHQAFIQSRVTAGKQGAAKRWHSHSTAINVPMANDSSASATASAVRTRVQNTRVGPAKPPPDPQVKEFVVWFQAEYKARRHGADYFVRWERDGALVKQMLGATTLERLKLLSQVMLSDKCADEFIIDTDRGIQILSTKFNWLSDRLAAWEAKGGTA